MDRRGFLKRAGAVVLAVVSAPLFIPSARLEFGVPKLIVAEWPPKLYGDGIHDDTAALQAMLDNGGTLDLKSGIYLVSAPLVVSRGGTHLSNATFQASAPLDRMLELGTMQNIALRNLTLRN